MSDVWTRARQSALALRHRLFGDAADTAESPAIIAAALADAGLSLHLRPPGDSLLAGSHAVLDRQFDAIWVRGDLPLATRAVLVAHELAHLIEMNHSVRFWNQVETLMPDWKPARAWLKADGASLHALGRYSIYK